MLKQIKRGTRGGSSRGQRGRGTSTTTTRRGRLRPGGHYGAGKRNKLNGRKSQIRTSHRRMSSRDAAEKRHSEARYLAAVKDFESAVRYFQRQKFDKAKEIFEKLLSSPAREVAARARVHVQLCEQKLNPAGRVPAAKTADDYYNLGVAELNGRACELAIEHLSKADKIEPNREHVRYVLAAAHALQGNTDTALEHLSAAISLRPDNRVRARSDEDFQSLAADPRFKQLVSS